MLMIVLKEKGKLSHAEDVDFNKRQIFKSTELS